MKKGISFLIFFLLALVTWGQPPSFVTLNTDSVYVEAGAGQPQVEGICSISNVSDVELGVSWQWNSIELPEGWNVEFCENNSCYPTSTDTVFYFQTDETVPFSVIFYPNGIPGTGKVKIRLYSATQGMHFEEQAVFVAKVDGLSSTSETEDGNTMTLFPNPARQELNLLIENRAYTQWQIVDLTGKQRLSGQIPAYRVDVKNLSPSIYIFQAMTAEKLIIATEFFVKE